MFSPSPFCPLAGFLIEEVKKKVDEVAEGREVEVVVLDESWIPPKRIEE